MERLTKGLVNWASILEDSTREQAERTASMPFIHPHLALMPDAHLGKGATVGSVIATLGSILPAAVGVDIGCGMCAVRTQRTRDDVLAAGPLAPLREAGAYRPVEVIMEDARDLVEVVHTLRQIVNVKGD